MDKSHQITNHISYILIHSNTLCLSLPSSWKRRVFFPYRVGRLSHLRVPDGPRFPGGSTLGLRRRLGATHSLLGLEIHHQNVKVYNVLQCLDVTCLVNLRISGNENSKQLVRTVFPWSFDDTWMFWPNFRNASAAVLKICKSSISTPKVFVGI